MRDWIAGAMLVLGTLLVLAGAAVRIMGALGTTPAAPAAPADAPTETAPARHVQRKAGLHTGNGIELVFVKDGKPAGSKDRPIGNAEAFRISALVG